MLLFLDYDGVLHPDSVFIERRRPVLRGPGELFMWCGDLIEALEPWPDLQIVLSTSWVRNRGFSRAKDALPRALSRRVVGATYHSAMSRRPKEEGGFLLQETAWDTQTRYEQIMTYVRRARVRNWLAIDDNNELWGTQDIDRLILTTSERGISDPGALSLLQTKLNSTCK